MSLDSDGTEKKTYKYLYLVQISTLLREFVNIIYMSEEDGGSYSVDDGLGDAEACCQLNHEALILCVR